MADTNTNAAGMTFDSFPVTQPTPASTATASDGGMTFDAAPTSTTITVPSPNATAPSQPAGSNVGTVATDIDVPGNLATGALHGLAQTGAGILGVAERLANPSGDPNNERQWFKSTKNWLNNHSQNTGRDNASSVEQGTGTGIEDLAEFFLGDEALKGLSVSDRLLRASKMARTVEDSPLLNRVFQAGVRALRGGAVGAVQGGVKTDTASGASTAAVGAGLGNAVLPEIWAAGKAAPRVVNTVSDALRGAEKVVQPELQSSLRQILSDTAAEHGITVPSDTAMRDTAEYVGQAIKDRASAIYRAIDEALDTRFQAYDEQLSAVRNALRNDTAVDHEYTGKLTDKYNELEAAKASAQQKAVDAGISPDAFKQSGAYWRQGSALQDLSAKLRQATTGLPENLNNGSKAASTASGEVVSPNKLVSKIHTLRDSGRLAEALKSQSRVDDLLRSVEAGKARTAEIAANRKALSKAAIGAAAAAGAGGVAGTAIRHALQ